jgi:hypothetical protein
MYFGANTEVLLTPLINAHDSHLLLSISAVGTQMHRPGVDSVRWVGMTRGVAGQRLEVCVGQCRDGADALRVGRCGRQSD